MRLRFVYYAVLLSLLQSCVADCKEEHIKKPVWQTTYDDYWIKQDSVRVFNVTVDTLVSYSVVEHSMKKYYLKNSYDELFGSGITHFVTLKNNNNTYSNDFRIRYIGKERKNSDRWVDFERYTDYVSIKPNKTHTFTFNYSDYWRMYNGVSEADVKFYVDQRPQKVTVTRKIVKTYNKKHIRRKDRLIYIDTIVNNCECDVDELKSEYKAIKETFERLKKENLIRE